MLTAQHEGDVLPEGSKHGGRTYREVWAADPKYCRWAATAARPGKVAKFAEWARAKAAEQPAAPPPPPEDVTKRVYLNIPYTRRGRGKELGALFDKERKLWYDPDGSHADLLKEFKPAREIALPGEDRSFGGKELFFAAAPATCRAALKKLVGADDWENLRRSVAERVTRKPHEARDRPAAEPEPPAAAAESAAPASPACEICGAEIPQGAKVHLAERWAYDDAAHVRALRRFEVLCDDCHKATQLLGGRGGEAYLKGRQRFLKISGLDEGEMSRRLVAAFAEWVERSRCVWKSDVSLLTKAGIVVAQE
jgi:hypothetical protein